MDPRFIDNVFRASYHNYPGHMLHGPFHRVRSTSQTAQNDLDQIKSGTLWGLLPRWGHCPTVQAYSGRLPPGAQGIEFFTPTRPHQINLPAGYGVEWYGENTAFTGNMSLNGLDYAIITIVVTRHVP